jgi:hypothetical protein
MVMTTKTWRGLEPPRLVKDMAPGRKYPVLRRGCSISMGSMTMGAEWVEAGVKFLTPHPTRDGVWQQKYDVKRWPFSNRGLKQATDFLKTFGFDVT